mmetsp:Transcript_21029/g.53826  ORF Transcript_21029/g.53826 Transcript_21029/m.53826 type:complete len:381 (+) Transcript_21029:1070-2212(+)
MQTCLWPSCTTRLGSATSRCSRCNARKRCTLRPPASRSLRTPARLACSWRARTAGRADRAVCSAAATTSWSPLQAHRLEVMGEAARRAEKQAVRDLARAQSSGAKLGVSAAERLEEVRGRSGLLDSGEGRSPTSRGVSGGPVSPTAKPASMVAAAAAVAVTPPPPPPSAAAGVDEDDEEAAAAAEMVRARMSRLSIDFQHDDDSSDDGADDADDALGSSAALSARSVSLPSPTVAGTAWEPRAYLLKRSPAKSLGLLGKKFAWQRRWFEVTPDTFCWYASSQAAAAGHEPLGRVPRSMVLTARPVGDASGFEVDLGNRVIYLQLDGVAKARHAECTRGWVEALTQQEVLGELQGEACSHKPKFWKVDQKGSPSPTKAAGA